MVRHVRCLDPADMALVVMNGESGPQPQRQPDPSALYARFRFGQDQVIFRELGRKRRSYSAAKVSGLRQHRLDQSNCIGVVHVLYIQLWPIWRRARARAACGQKTRVRERRRPWFTAEMYHREPVMLDGQSVGIDLDGCDHTLWCSPLSVPPRQDPARRATVAPIERAPDPGLIVQHSQILVTEPRKCPFERGETGAGTVVHLRQLSRSRRPL